MAHGATPRREAVIAATSRMMVEYSVPDHGVDLDIPLVAAFRGDHVETLHRGRFVVVDPDGTVVVAAGDSEHRTYLRSSAKPFQAVALFSTGAVLRFNLSDRDIAIACASHSGEPEHVGAVQSLLSKANLTEDLLQCGAHAPNNPAAATKLSQSGASPTAVHNNCSGKHAGMLVACAAMGWPLEPYLDFRHPLQQQNLRTLAAFAGLPVGSIDVGVDGCGVPAFFLSLRGVATAFARLATGSNLDRDLQSAANRIREAMMNNSFLVAGTDRFDTELMKSARHAIVCKGGAQGFEGIGLVDKHLGAAIKMTDGVSFPGAVASVQLLDGIDVAGTLDAEFIQRYAEPVIRNHSGTLVGSHRAVFSIVPAA